MVYLPVLGDWLCAPCTWLCACFCCQPADSVPRLSTAHLLRPVGNRNSQEGRKRISGVAKVGQLGWTVYIIPNCMCKDAWRATPKPLAFHFLPLICWFTSPLPCPTCYGVHVQLHVQGHGQTHRCFCARSAGDQVHAQAQDCHLGKGLCRKRSGAAWCC